MENLLSKSVKAAATLLERKDYEVLDRGWEPGCIGVGHRRPGRRHARVRRRQGPRGAEGGLPEMPGAFRKRAEEAAARWLATNGDRVGDVRVRFDFVSFLVLDEGRALARHVINALGEEGSLIGRMAAGGAPLRHGAPRRATADPTQQPLPPRRFDGATPTLPCPNPILRRSFLISCQGRSLILRPSSRQLAGYTPAYP